MLVLVSPALVKRFRRKKTIEGVKDCESYMKAISGMNMHSGGVNRVLLVFANSFAILKVTE